MTSERDAHWALDYTNVFLTTIGDNEGQSLVGDVSHVTATGDDEVEDNSYNDYNLLQLFCSVSDPTVRQHRQLFRFACGSRVHADFFRTQISRDLS